MNEQEERAAEEIEVEPYEGAPDDVARTLEDGSQDDPALEEDFTVVFEPDNEAFEEES